MKECDETYHGTEPASELEVQNIKKYFKYVTDVCVL